MIDRRKVIHAAGKRCPGELQGRQEYISESSCQKNIANCTTSERRHEIQFGKAYTPVLAIHDKIAPDSCYDGVSIPDGEVYCEAMSAVPSRENYPEIPVQIYAGETVEKCTRYCA